MNSFFVEFKVIWPIPGVLGVMITKTLYHVRHGHKMAVNSVKNAKKYVMLRFQNTNKLFSLCKNRFWNRCGVIVQFWLLIIDNFNAPPFLSTWNLWESFKRWKCEICTESPLNGCWGVRFKYSYWSCFLHSRSYHSWIHILGLLGLYWTIF